MSPHHTPMKKVEPIRSLKQLSAIKNMLRWQWKIRDLLLLELWVNSALKITDLLSLQTKHLYDEQWEPKTSFTIQERKTKKSNTIVITPKVTATLRHYAQQHPSILANQENYIFYSKKHIPHGTQQLDRRTARKMINKRCSDVWLKWSYWWHTLRKTRGYQARLKGISIELIQHRLNHISLRITKLYLGITYQELNEACLKLDL